MHPDELLVYFGMLLLIGVTAVVCGGGFTRAAAFAFALGGGFWTACFFWREVKEWLGFGRGTWRG